MGRMEFSLFPVKDKTLSILRKIFDSTIQSTGHQWRDEIKEMLAVPAAHPAKQSSDDFGSVRGIHVVEIGRYAPVGFKEFK